MSVLSTFGILVMNGASRWLEASAAKAMVWTSPKPKEKTHGRPRKMGMRLLTAARSTESAMADSTQRDGRRTAPKAARLRVTECARVKVDTTRSVRRSADPNEETGRHFPFS